MALEKLLNMFKEKPVAAEAPTPAEAPPTPWSDPSHPVNQLGPAAAAPESVHGEAAPTAGDQDVSDAPLPDLEATREAIVRNLRTVYDPEIPVNIYDLGLIYELHLNEAREALIRMTLTSPNCPSAGELPGQIEARARAAAGVRAVTVELVWEPPWNKDMMSDAARLELGMY